MPDGVSVGVGVLVGVEVGVEVDVDVGVQVGVDVGASVGVHVDVPEPGVGSIVGVSLGGGAANAYRKVSSEPVYITPSPIATDDLIALPVAYVHASVPFELMA